MEARTLIAGGEDPFETRRMAEVEKKASASDTTFREAAESVYEDLIPGFRNAKHAAQWIITFQTYVFPIVGKRLVSELRASDFAERALAHNVRNAVEAACHRTDLLDQRRLPQ